MPTTIPSREAHIPVSETEKDKDGPEWHRRLMGFAQTVLLESHLPVAGTNFHVLVGC